VPLSDGWTCILCADSHKHTYANTSRHEKTVLHQTLIEEAARREREDEDEEATHNKENTTTELPTALEMVDRATRNLLASLTESSSRTADRSASHDEDAPEPAPVPIEGWGAYQANEDTDLALSLEQQGIALVAQSVLDRLDEISVGSADGDDERSAVDEDDVPEPIVPGECPC